MGSFVVLCSVNCGISPRRQQALVSHMHIYGKVCSDLPVLPETRCSGPFEVGFQHGLFRATELLGQSFLPVGYKSKSLLGK